MSASAEEARAGAGAPAPRGARRGRLTLPRALGFGAVALLSAVLTLWLTAERLPPLAPEELARARARWERAAPARYRLLVAMEGSELARGTYEVEADGAATAVRRDGLAITGDVASYRVEGLLRLLEQELALLETPARLGAPAGYRAYVFARFDARGVPVRYRRVVGGANRWAEWRVLALEER